MLGTISAMEIDDRSFNAVDEQGSSSAAASEIAAAKFHVRSEEGPRRGNAQRLQVRLDVALVHLQMVILEAKKTNTDVALVPRGATRRRCGRIVVMRGCKGTSKIFARQVLRQRRAVFQKAFGAKVAQGLCVNLGNNPSQACESHCNGVDLDLKVPPVAMGKIVLAHQQQPRLCSWIFRRTAGPVNTFHQVQQTRHPKVRRPQWGQLLYKPRHVD
mmetsp:Transcript_98107/g.299973  ORF Transcript_98107/g.299973 Transcript_98107/m.299973 type:complete len:215 (-) Transcript_98107:539-1183(-)